MCDEDHEHAQWSWLPHKTGEIELTTTHKHLEKFKKDMTFISGLSHPLARKIGGHQSGNSFLTAANLQKSLQANTVSLDQYIANNSIESTRYKSLVMATDGGVSSGSQTRTLSFTKDGVPIPSVSSPEHLYKMLFVNDSGDVETRRREILKKGKLLDSVLEHSKSLQKKLSTHDKEKMEQYLESVRSIEKQIEQSRDWLDKPKPVVKEKISAFQTDPLTAEPEKYFRCMYDIMALALITDSCRVMTYMTGTNHSLNSIADKFPARMNMGAGHHKMAHSARGEGVKKQGLWDQFLSKQFGYFINKLAAHKEFGQSILDNTVVLYGSSNSKTHNNTNYPLMLCGGKNFGFKHNQHVSYDQDIPMSNLFLTILNKLDVPAEPFADSNGTLAEI